MADLKQALLWLAEGKKVFNTGFTDSKYIEMRNALIVDDEDDAAEYLLDARADWELYEEPKPAIEDFEYDAEYIVWDAAGNRDFAFWCPGDKAFYSLHAKTSCALDVHEWKKLPLKGQ